MNHQKEFFAVFEPALRKDGYIRKDNCLFCHLPEQQLLKCVHMDILGGKHHFRIIADIYCYADVIEPYWAKYTMINDMDMIIPNLRGQKPRIATAITEPFKEQLQERLSEFLEHFYPKMQQVDDVKKCYFFQKFIGEVLMLNIAGENLLFESFQCGLYEDALRYAKIDIKNKRQLLYSFVANVAKSKGSLSGDQVRTRIRELEADVNRAEERIEELRSGVIHRLSEELEKRIAISAQNCKVFFQRRSNQAK